MPNLGPVTTNNRAYPDFDSFLAGEFALSSPGGTPVFSESVYIQVDSTNTSAPEIHFNALNGDWLMGVDVANNGGAKDFVVAAKKDHPTAGAVADVIYVAHRGSDNPTIGLGVTPPDGSYRVQMSSPTDEAAMGVCSILVGAGVTGKALTFKDSSNTERLWVDKDFWWGGTNAALAFAVGIKGDAANQRPLAFAKNDGTAVYGWEYNGSTLRFRYLTGALNIFQFGTDGSAFVYNAMTFGNSLVYQDNVHHVFGTTTGSKLGTATTQKLGFWNATPVVQPAHANQAAVTDSTGGTAGFTLADVTATPTQELVNNNFASLARQVNELRNVLVNTGLMKGAA